MLELKRYILTELKAERITKLEAASSIKQLNSEDSFIGMPLLQRRVSMGNDAVYLSEFSGEEHFLSDHKVLGNKILPGVAYVEMAASSAKDYLSRKGINPKSISLTNVVFSQPFVVNASKAIAIVLSSVSGKKDIHFSVSSHSDTDLCIHAEGTITNDNQLTEETLNLTALHSKNKTLIDSEKFYSIFEGMGIEYGATHKAVSEISIGSDGVFDESVIASLALPSDLVSCDQREFYLHPSILDGALQTSIALDVERFTVETHPAVPFRVDRIDVFSGVPAGKSLVVANKNALFDNNVNDVFDFFVCHPDGKVYLKMSGFYARPYGKPFREIGAQQAHVVDACVASTNTSVVNGNSLQKLVGELTLVPSWDVINIESTAVKAPSDIPHTAIVVGGVPEQIEVLKTQFSRLVHVDSTTLNTVKDITEALSLSDKVSHVVWFVPDSECDESFSAVIDMQNEGVLFGLQLVKSLLALHYDAESLSLVVVTQRSLATYATDLVNPTHGGVHGFVGALAKEYEHWRVRQIDLSSDMCSPLRDIHYIPEGVTEFAHRHDQWFKKSLLLTSLAPASTSAYEKGGVYILFGGAGGLGVLLSEYLVKNYDAKIIWVGRRKENDEIERLCTHVEKFGQRPTYFSVDTMSAKEVGVFRETIYKRHSRINGIVFTALVLNDGALLTMDEEQFKSSLAAKVDLSVNVVNAFDTDSLDFMLFFSSLQSEFRAVGQSNYAAGSTFIDSFSAAVRQKVKYPVKVVSWGYWGSTGIVASDFYRTRMASLGINEIHQDKGMKLVEELLSSAVGQVGYIETDKAEVALSIGVSLADHVHGLKKEDTDSFVFSENTTLPMSEVEYSKSIGKLNGLLDELLLFQLLEANAIFVDGDVISVVTIEGYLHLWLQQSLRNLVGTGLVSELSDEYQISTETIRQISDVWDRWGAFTKGVNNTSPGYPGFSNKLQLVELTLKSLPSILSGKLPATTVMFPEGDLSLIEGLYKNNLISDHFNSIVAEQVLSSVKRKFDSDQQPVRILEVGAGSGGTSEKIFDVLEPVSDAVCQYTFTDVSKIFLNHAEANYGENVDFLETKLFDVSVPAQEQSLPLGHYDFVVATNVLHACGDIRSALRNCKTLLKSGGVAFINEAICSDSYLHCTFGLLEGWWLFKDGELRIPGSPIVSSGRWKRVLAQEGFYNINTPCASSEPFQQQVIIAESDGVVRQQFTSPIENKCERNVVSVCDRIRSTTSGELKVRDLLPQDKKIFKQRLSDSIASVISDVVEIDKGDIHYEMPLSQVGVDSILVVKITNALRKTFSGIDSTLLFDCNSVESLSNYFIENNLSSVQGLFGDEQQHNTVALPHRREDSGVPSSASIESKAPAFDPALQALLVDLIRKVMSEVLRVDYEDVGPRQAFEELGIDSILTVQISNAIKQQIGSFESTLLFDYRNIESLATFLVNDAGVREKLSQFNSAHVASPASKPHGKEKLNGADNDPHLGSDAKFYRNETGPEGLVSEIAIVGLSGRYAKANNVEEFWENLKRGKNCIDEVPELRWDWSEHLYPRRDGSGKIYTKWGGFIDGADHFDPLFFSISPREAENMDPQERLFLQCAYSTIEDAGYTPERLSESKTGVFAGVMNNTYQRQPSHWSVANRVSYCLNFDGPSFSIDTACSSSLTAIHLACNSLKLGECKQAIAGGVNIIESPAHYEGLTEMNMLSESNQCRSFGDAADGFVDGEGVGAVLLKPFNEAIQDGDHIYGVIRGSAINHGGRTNGYTVPSPSAQANVISTALDSAGVVPGDISYIEAHGTGTELGDPIEFAGLSRALGKDKKEKQFCALGSVKSNIGHCESAAGIAGLTKVLLQMKHKQLVPSLHSTVANKNIDFANSPFSLQKSLSDWRPVCDGNNTIPRIAGMSSFGAGGANAHLIVEEYNAPCDSTPGEGKFIFVFSAKTKAALDRRVSEFVSFLDKAPEALGEIAYTLQVGREHLPHRLALVASSISDLSLKLMTRQSAGKSAGVFSSVLEGRKEGVANGIDSDDQSYIVERYISNGQYEKLAKLWCQGFEISWSDLYPAAPRKVSLPTYPFEKERYWEPKKTIAIDSIKEDSNFIPDTDIGRNLKENTSGHLNEIVQLSEVLIPSILSTDSLEEFSVEQILIFGSPNDSDTIIDSGLSDICGVIKTINVSSGFSASDDVMDVGLDKSKPLVCIHLYALSGESNERDYVAIENHTRLVECVKAVKVYGFKDVQHKFCGVSHTEIERSYLESWFPSDKSLQMIAPGHRISVIIEVDTAKAEVELGVDYTAWVQRLTEELAFGGGRNVVYLDGVSHVYTLKEPPVGDADFPPTSIIKEHGTYLITGGLGGLAMVFARHLAEQYCANLVLCGRSDLDDSRNQKVSELSDLGATVDYFSASVVNESEMRLGVERACQKFGVIDGVFHIAGIENELNVFDKSSDDFNEVYSTKVSGALILDEILADQPLDFVAYFSSISAVMGDLGAVDYAASNRFLLSYAEHREQRRSRGEVQGKSIALAWPLMLDGGMESADSEKVKLYLQSSGQAPMDALDAISLFENTLHQDVSKVIALYGVRDRIRRFIGIDTSLDENQKEHAEGAAFTEEKRPVASDDIPTNRSRISRPELKGFSLSESVMWDLKDIASGLLKIDRSRLGDNENLADFGFDSISLAMFAKSLSAHFDVDVTPSVFFSYSTLGDLRGYFEDKYADVLKTLYLSAASTTESRISERVSPVTPAPKITSEIHNESPSQSRGDDSPTSINNEAIAVVGMSGRFPGARNIEELWSILSEGRSAVDEIPADRFDWRDYFGDPIKEPGTTNGKWLGAIPGVDEFDPKFFEISPVDAEKMDPRQRLLLQESWNALEDAGLGPSHLSQQTVGMYVGVEQGDYQDLMDESPLTANHDGILAARLAYMLNLSGPALAINTACSSGLVAAHEACLSLRSNECDTAIAAGVNILLRPDAFVAMGKAGMLSSDGKCHAFSEDANGMVPGEAVVAVVLKRFSDAERDGDPIYGVIRGSGINYDGKTNGITAPSGKAQSALLRGIYDRYHVSPADIEYVVTHGTGTRLGDPVEINALYDVFKPAQKSQTPHCALTSTKSNLGHTFAASGLVSFVSLLLAMRYETIPASLHCDVESDYIPWASSPFYVNKKSKVWPKKNRPRLGALSAFGMSGTNAHMVVESYDAQFAGEELPNTHQYYLLPLSAKSESALKTRIEELDIYLQAQNKSDINLLSLSYTLFLGRHHFKHRAAIVVQDCDDAIQTLAVLRNGERAPKVFRGEVDRDFSAQTGLMNFGDTQLLSLSKKDKTVDEQSALFTLSDLYCQGYDLAWERMFGAAPPVRSNLPTYPFSREYYWVSQKDIVSKGNTAYEVKSVGIRGYSRHINHPLLHRNSSTLKEYKFSSTFTGEEVFFDQHVVNGSKTFPGVAYIEMALAAGNEVLDSSNSIATGVEDVVFRVPLIVSDRSIDVTIFLFPENEKCISFKVISFPEDQDEISHASGKITISGGIAKDRSEAIVLPNARQSSRISSDRCYKYFDALGLSYGASFQGIDTIYPVKVSHDLISVTRLKSVSTLSVPNDRYILFPGYLDSVLQSCIGLVLSEAGDMPVSLSIPFSIGSIVVFEKLPESESLYAVARDLSKGGDSTYAFEVQLIDENGKVYLQIDDFCSRRISDVNTLSGLKVLGVDDSQDPSSYLELLVPIWISSDVPLEPKADYEGHVILCGIEETNREDELYATLTGISCVNLNGEQGALVDSFTLMAWKLLQYLQELLIHTVDKPLYIQLVVPNDSSFCYRALFSMLRCFALETSRTYVQLVQCDLNGDITSLSQRLEAERDSKFVNEVVRYTSAGQRETLQYQKQSQSEKAYSSLVWHDRGIYLISGGAGGIGMIVAHDISEKVHHSTIVLLGRRALDEEIEEKISALEEEGRNNTVVYYSVDVSDVSALEGVVGEVNHRFGPVTAVIHAAGTSMDSAIKNKTRYELDEVFTPKVNGILALDSATTDQPLEMFLAFSSLSAVYGNIGQSDYSVANAFMDEFSINRKNLVESGERCGRTLSINWPLWESGGMEVDSATLKYLENSSGMTVLSSEEGIKSLICAVSLNSPQVLVLSNQSNSEGVITRANDKPVSLGPQRELSAKMQHDTKRGKKTGGSPYEIRKALVYFISEQLKVKVEDIDFRAEFSEFGFDSVSLTVFSNTLNETYGLELSPAVFFEFSTVELFSKHLFDEYRDHFADYDVADGCCESSSSNMNIEPPINSNTSPSLSGDEENTHSVSQYESIAIIGISCNFPQSDGIENYWENLLHGRDCIREIPDSRWDWEKLFGDARRETNKTNIRHAGVIDGLELFDHTFFGLTLREAEALDPQQRLLMTHVWRAIEDSGHAPESLSGSNTGVFVGTGNSGYGNLVTASGVPIEGYSAAGMASSVGPNRISFLLNLHGPSEPIETACSSSLVAVHRAMGALRSGQCNQAIVGGVNLLVCPDAHISFDKAGMLSSEGRCKTFSDGANGYVRGEGIGVLILKPLSKAEEDGDHIYALIKGSAENHGGRSNSLTAPNTRAQADVIKDAFKNAKIDPNTVNYVEAHGTGTPLGDPVEIEGIKRAFSELHLDLDGSFREEHCDIGAVKSNIGHLELAAGIAGVIKVILQMRHRILVPSLHCETLNPHIELQNSPFSIVRETKPWLSVSDSLGNTAPLRAGVSSFGFGGVNAHVLLEEYVSVSPASVSTSSGPYPIVLSAKNSDQLLVKISQLYIFISQRNNIHLESLAFTLQLGRDEMAYRWSCLVHSLDELALYLSHGMKSSTNIDNIFSGNLKKNSDISDLDRTTNKLVASILISKDESRYSSLCEAWVKGASIDWIKLYDTSLSQVPKRMALPTYPFLNTRCWIDGLASVYVESNTKSGRDKEGLDSVYGEYVSEISTLVHKNISSLSQQRFLTSINSSDAIVRDHVVKNKNILPAAAYIDMVCVALGQSMSISVSESITLENVTFLKPVVAVNDTEEIYTEISVERNGDVVFSIYSQGEPGERVDHAQGKAVVGEERLSTVGFDADIFIGDENAPNTDIDGAECYAKFDSIGISYGETFQVIDSIYLGDAVNIKEANISTVVAKMIPADMRGYSSPNDVFHVNPTLLDGAFQSCIGFSFEENADVAIPFSIEKIIVHRSMDGAALSVTRKSDGGSEFVKKYDIDMVDENKQPYIQIRGFCARVYSSSIPVQNEAGYQSISSNIYNEVHRESLENSGSVQGVSTERKKQELLERISSDISLKLSEQLKVEIGDIDVECEFSEFGLDSVSLTVLGNALTQAYEVELAPTSFFEYPTIAKFSSFLVMEEFSAMCRYFSISMDVNPEPKPENNQVEFGGEEVGEKDEITLGNPKFNKIGASALPRKPFSAVENKNEPIAIIGVSGCFPESPDLDDFWENLEQGNDCIGEIPDSRWDWNAFFGDSSVQPNKTSVKHAGVIESIAEFDPLFFGVSPREAASMDPQQRLLMTYVWKVIEDSGHAPSSLGGSNTGIFIGTGNSGYGAQLSAAGADVESYSAAGMVGSIGPNRMSFLLDLHGPSEPIETACSSSLVAVHRAVGAIRSGQCDQAIVGGVNALVSPETHISFDKAGMLSKDGRCKTFSHNANGYVRGEGVGMLLLKPLTQAEMDGDNIYALIRGSAENHGGRSNSLTSPNPKAQAELIKAALTDADVKPETISYIEAHGTGTSLGDPIEINGLKMAFSEMAKEDGRNLDSGFCGLGSVKSNIGHLELAAGVAGMVKVLLQMKHKTLAPSLHCDEQNRYIDLENSPFDIVRECREWTRLKNEKGDDVPRRAGVSSFGFGGVNAHVVMEEYVSPTKPFKAISSQNTTDVLVVISAKTHEGVERKIGDLLRFISSREVDLDSLSYTLQVGRDAMAHRWACVASSIPHLTEILGEALDGGMQSKRVYQGEVKSSKGLAGIFYNDADFANTLGHWLSQGMLDKVAKLWVNGVDIDWSRLHKGFPHRSSLPSYPFEKNRYWIEEVIKHKSKDLAYPNKLESQTNGGHRESLHGVLRELSKRTISVDEAIKKVAK